MSNIHKEATPEVAAVKGNESINAEETQVVVNQEEVQAEVARFSFFKGKANNCTPNRLVTLDEVYDYIKNNGAAEVATKKLRTIEDIDGRRKFKKENFDYVTFSGQFSYRNEKSLIKHSGLVCIDFDHLGDALESTKEVLRNDPYFETLLLFVSPSGDGLKWVIPIDTAIASHKDWYKSIRQYLLERYNLITDSSCANVCSACFLPHDDEVIVNGSYNTEFQKFNPYKYNDKMKKKTLKEKEQEIIALVEKVKNRGIDLTEDFNNWLHIGFALATEFGEDGRKYYHELSNNYSKYTSKEVDKKYDNFLKDNNGEVTLGTLFYIAKQAGISLNEVDETVDYKKYIVSADETFNEADYILECEDVKFFSKGNICFIKAKEKAGKTLSICVMIGALLRGELFKLKAVNKETKILVADTEQTRKNTVDRYKLALKLGGYGDDTPLLKVLNLRGENYKTRKKIIFDAIEKEKPDIVFIDGLVDLITDFNNVDQSQQIIERLTSEATKNNCCIVSVIHTNPGADNGKMRGHFGTMAANKGGVVLKCSKNNGIFTVSTDCCREEEPPSWSFRFDNDGNIVDGKTKVENKDEELTRLVKEFITEKGGKTTRSELAKMAMGKNLWKNDSSVYEHLKKIEDKFVVEKDDWSIPS